MNRHFSSRIRRGLGSRTARAGQRHRMARLEPLEDRRLLSLDFAWGFGLGSTGVDEGHSVGLDSSGNVYLAGRYEAANGVPAVDFNPSPTVASPLSSGTNIDSFAARYTSGGAYAWAKDLDSGNISETAIAADGTGVGTFEWAGWPTSVLRVGKTSATGTALGVYDMLGQTSSHVHGSGIALGPQGSIYTTGMFNQRLDLDPDPGPGNQYRTAAGDDDIFVSKLSSSGSYLWGLQFGGIGHEVGGDIAVDAAGNAYIAGTFSETVDFDPGLTATAYRTCSGSGRTEDIFVLKLDPAGRLLWVRQLGTMASDVPRGIALDAANNVYITGYSYGDSDFDPERHAFSIDNRGQGDVFVAKLTAAGEPAWVKTVGGPGVDQPEDIAVGAAGLFITGAFQNTVDFDPDAGQALKTSAGGDDVFLLRLSPETGAFQNIVAFGAAGGDSGRGLALGSNGAVYLTGQFAGSFDVNPGSGVTTLAAHGGDITKTDAFLTRWTVGDPPPPPIDIQMKQFTADGGSRVSLTYEVLGGPAAAFSIGFYKSADALYQTTDASLGTYRVSRPADLSVGTHTLPIALPASGSTIALPGFGTAETNDEYRLLAVADPTNALAEIDLNPVNEDNTAAFAGVYHPAGGTVYVFGTPAADTLALAPGSLRVTCNSFTKTYAGTDVSGVRVRTYAGNDAISFNYGAGFGNTSPVDVWIQAGAGDDTATLVGSSLTGSANADRATISPASMTLAGPNYKVTLYSAKDARVDGGGGGGDSASFYDSPGNDTFVARWNLAYLTDTSTYNHTAVGFARVNAFARSDAGGSGDVAKFFDSPSDDAYLGQGPQTYSAIGGTVGGQRFYNYADKFDCCYVINPAGGRNTATLADTAGDDYLQVDTTTARLYANNAGTLKLYQSVAGFPTLAANRTTGRDIRNIVAGLPVTAAGWLAELRLPVSSSVPLRQVIATSRENVGDPAGLAVRFQDGANYTVDVPVFQADAGALEVVIPAYISAVTHNTAIGYVDVTLLRDNVPMAASRSRLRILDLLGSRLPVGSISLGYLRAAREEAAAQIVARRQTFLDTADNLATWQAMLADYDQLIAAIVKLKAAPSTPIPAGRIGSTNVALDMAGLAELDRWIRTLIDGEAALATEGELPAPVSAGSLRGLAAARTTTDSTLEAAAVLKEKMSGQSETPQTAWTQHASAARTSGTYTTVRGAGYFMAGAGGVATGLGAVALCNPLGLTVGAAASLVAGGLLLTNGGSLIACATDPQIDAMLAEDRATAARVASECGEFLGHVTGSFRQWAQHFKSANEALAANQNVPPPAEIRVFRQSTTTSERQDQAAIAVSVWPSQRPTGSVIVEFSIHDDGTEGRIAGNSAVWFTPDSYQGTVIYVAGKDDQYADGSQLFQLTATITSYDPAFADGQIDRDFINLDDEPRLAIGVFGKTTLATTYVQEGAQGERPWALFEVRLSALSEEPIDFVCRATDVTAWSGTDYVGGVRSGTIPAGVQMVQIGFEVIGNDRDEDLDEKEFSVALDAIPGVPVTREAEGVIHDDDVAGVTTAPSSGLTTTEASRSRGGQASFDVWLNSEPLAPVSIAVSSSDTSEGTVSPRSLSFNSTNWRTHQTVVVTGVDDTTADGNVNYVVRGAATSNDRKYALAAAFSVAATNIDDDQLQLFDGSYSGRYSGTDYAPPPLGTHQVSGSLAFRVNNGVITFTSPSGSGTVDAAGNLRGTLTGFSGPVLFEGKITIASTGAASASGSWSETYDGGCAEGTWSASRPARALAAMAAPDMAVFLAGLRTQTPSKLKTTAAIDMILGEMASEG